MIFGARRDPYGSPVSKPEGTYKQDTIWAHLCRVLPIALGITSGWGSLTYAKVMSGPINIGLIHVKPSDAQNHITPCESRDNKVTLKLLGLKD